MERDVNGEDEPLIRPPLPSREGVEEEEYNDYESSDRAFEVPGVFIWVLTFCAGVSGLLFGYE